MMEIGIEMIGFLAEILKLVMFNAKYANNE